MNVKTRHGTQGLKIRNTGDGEGVTHRLPKIQSIIIYNKSKVHAPHTSENASRTQPHSEPLTTLTQTTKEAQQGEVSGGEAQLLPMKTILVWTYTAGCEVDSCYLTKNKTMVPLDAFDATLFHFRSLKADNLPNKRHDVVPVVLGGSNYTSITPPHSIINVKDFPSITALINHLKYLDGNDTAYNEYFWWKKQYQVVDGWRGGAQGFCDLCKKLHEDQSPKVYSDIRDWFVGQGECLRLNLRVAS
ncbi:Alpha-(1,3)-fucosyltransferase C [Portunus trituberculatus]|uniref:Fucosyltransferase n=1 Tax=Portunus trituberculatus TaxID=210409 RepID=A0A5B7FAP8_PORTR|nr:Alpha-(1,3)-fucosyltransferase C [Portunus trituberculatus]